MRIRALTGTIGLTVTLDYYRDLWPSSTTRHYEGWTVVSREQRDTFSSVLLRATAFGCEGFIVESDHRRLNAAAAAPQTRVPLPHGMRVISHQRYDDDGREGETLTLASYQQPSTLRINFHGVMRAAGWKLIGARAAETTSNGFVAEYGHGDRPDQGIHSPRPVVRRSVSDTGAPDRPGLMNVFGPHPHSCA